MGLTVFCFGVYIGVNQVLEVFAMCHYSVALELRHYSVAEVEVVLGLDGFEHSEHFSAWINAHKESIDWTLIAEATERFRSVRSDLSGLKEVVEWARTQVDFRADLSTTGCNIFSIRCAPSVKTGLIPDRSYLSIGTHWDGQYFLTLSQVGSRGCIPWCTYGTVIRLPLGPNYSAAAKAGQIMAQSVGKPALSVA